MGSESSQNMVIYTLFDVLVFISFPTIPCQQREITQIKGNNPCKVNVQNLTFQMLDSNLKYSFLPLLC